MTLKWAEKGIIRLTICLAESILVSLLEMISFRALFSNQRRHCSLSRTTSPFSSLLQPPADRRSRDELRPIRRLYQSRVSLAPRDFGRGGIALEFSRP